jgi:hypothetical protein
MPRVDLAYSRACTTNLGGVSRCIAQRRGSAASVPGAQTPTDNSPRTDPILAFHFKGKKDYIMLRCNKAPELSIKGKDQTAGEVKFFAYSDFSEYTEADVLFKLKDEILLVELYRKGRSRPSRSSRGPSSSIGSRHSTRTAFRSLSSCRASCIPRSGIRLRPCRISSSRRSKKP